MIQSTATTNAAAPVAINAYCQPQVSNNHTTRIGVTIAPTELPIFAQPVATERSLGGNHRAAVFTVAGMLADAATPSSPRKAAIACQLPAKACSTADRPQRTAKMK